MLTDLPAKRHQLLPIVDEKVARNELRVIRLLREKMATTKRGGAGAETGAVADEGEGEGEGEGGAGPCAAAGAREADVLENALSAWGGTALSAWGGAASLTKEEGGEAFRGGDIALLSRARHETALRKVVHAVEMLEVATASHKVAVFAH